MNGGQGAVSGPAAPPHPRYPASPATNPIRASSQVE
jgi:hypothetical protein